MMPFHKINEPIVHVIVPLIEDVEKRLDDAHSRLQYLQQLQSKLSILDPKRLAQIIDRYDPQNHYNSVYFKQSTMWRDDNPNKKRSELVAHFKKQLGKLECMYTQITQMATGLINKNKQLASSYNKF